MLRIFQNMMSFPIAKRAKSPSSGFAGSLPCTEIESSPLPVHWIISFVFGNSRLLFGPSRTLYNPTCSVAGDSGLTESQPNCQA
jgi:hypothetical protein